MNQAPVFAMRMMTSRLEQLRLKETPRRARVGLTLAGEMLMQDSILVEPKAPVDTTSLIGSASVFVEGEKVADSAYGVPGTTSRYDQREYVDYRAVEGEDTFLPDTYQADVVFNAPYAAVQHEQYPKKAEPGTGMHYISTKIGTFISRYLDAIYGAIYMGPENSPDPNAKRTR